MSTDNQNIATQVQEVAERASLLVREEIELAKTEITAKITKLIKGIVVGAAAGIFAITGLLFLLHGFAWLAWFALPVDSNAFFWGFFVVAGVLFLLGGIAGFLAARFIKAGKNPKPEMAIDEAHRIRETVQEARS